MLRFLVNTQNSTVRCLSSSRLFSRKSCGIILSSFLAILYLIWGSTFFTKKDDYYKFSDDTTAAGFLIFTGVLLISASASLILGLIKKNPNFVLAWLVFQFYQFIVSITAGILYIKTYYYFSLIIFVANGILIYLWIRIFKFYNRLERGALFDESESNYET